MPKPDHLADLEQLRADIDAHDRRQDAPKADFARRLRDLTDPDTIAAEPGAEAKALADELHARLHGDPADKAKPKAKADDKAK